MPDDDTSVLNPKFAFLSGGEEMGAFMRAHDWSNSGVGPVDSWPQSLRIAIRLLLNTGHPMYIFWGPEGSCFHNDAYRQSIGAERHPSSLGKPAREVWAEIWEVIGPQIDQVMSGGGPTWHENALVPITRNGRREDVYWTYSYGPIDDETAPNGIGGVLVVCTETTEQVERASQLAAERDLLWSMPSLLLAIAGFDTTIIAVNPGWSALLGWEENDLLGNSYAGFIHPDDADRSVNWAERLASGEAVEELVNLYRRKDGGYRSIAWTIVRGNEVFHCVGRDVTVEIAQAATIVAAEEQLRQSQKMEAVGQLTGGLAHDFNNLLTGIMGNLELLQLRVANGRLDDLDRFVNAAQGAGRRAASLTQRLLAFSRWQTLDPKPTDVNRLITGMEDMLRRTVGPLIPIEVVGAAELWTTLIDPGQLENSLLNLCINGRDAMPAGGRLTIETANRSIDERSPRESDFPPGQYLSLCVTDTGTGMTPETAARAFDPFYTTKPIGEGTGLGLSMIYGFARQSGGQVRIYSKVGAGTTVCIYLPRHLGEAEATGAIESDPDRQSGAGETVLVVDDEPTIRHLIEEVLDELGYAVIVAGDGAAGLRALQSGARVDLLITDVGLPNGMNGRQVADAARSLRPGLKVLFITGYAENAAVGNGSMEPGMELLTKPFSMNELGRRVRTMLVLE